MGPLGPRQHHQQEEIGRIYRRGCPAGMRLLESAAFAAMVLSQVANSEALRPSPHALRSLPDVPCGLGGHAPVGCGSGAAANRKDGVLGRRDLSALRGGAFNWGAPEQQSSGGRRGASSIFSGAWGGGSSGSNNNDNSESRRRRVDTRGPPDLNPRLPPTAPGSDNGDGRGGYFGGGGGGGAGSGGSERDRVKTVGPPDGGGGRRGGRRGLFSPGPAPTAQVQQQQAGGRFGGGRADPFLAGAKPRAGWGSGGITFGRDDGEGDGPVRGWGEGGGSHLPDRRRGLMAVHYLVLSCFMLFSLNTLFGVDRLFRLSLNHSKPRWWQCVTSLLLHGDQHHLMGNMFNLIIFGKMAEEDMGSIGMLASFVACGVASSFVSLMIMPRTISSCGASGAIFGLYSVCVLGKTFNLGRRSSSEGRLRKLVEAAVFGWFVVESVMSEMRMVVAGGVTGIDHAAHFGGVLAGALLILLFRRSFRDQRVREKNLRDGSA
ncbi:unnamed protein product [Scytosiphon promiscuus]